MYKRKGGIPVRQVRIAALFLALALLCGGCEFGEKRGFAPKGAAGGQSAMEQGLEAQLGLLSQAVTAEERAACAEIWEKLWPLRQDRLERGLYRTGDYEGRLARRLRKLLDEYTVKYLDGSGEGFGYLDPPYVEVASYAVVEGDDIALKGEVSGWSEGELEALWEDIRAMLPQGAFADFGRFDVFTDGPDETLAYVYAMDAFGARWVLAVDPEDAGDSGDFTETILHEYCHYLTLNSEQVNYTRQQTTDTYNEYGMVSLQGSYLDDFYQAFWTDYIDDCLAGADTYNFALRHYDDFVTAYASTDPSEDICESFTYFVLWERGRTRDVWEKKLDFFYQYPELVEFRTAVRESLGLGNH